MKKLLQINHSPKKKLSNKDKKSVEDRKKKLQTYIRQIVNLVVQTNPPLQSKPDKEQVIMLMPFFAENSHLRSAGSTSTGSAASNQRPTVFGQRRRANGGANAEQILHQLAI